MERSMRYVMLMAGAVLLYGCGTPAVIQTTTLAKPSVHSSAAASFEFRDARPLAETMSRKEASPNGTTIFLGDNSLNPTGPELVKAALQQALDAKLAGKAVALTEFTLYVYDHAATVDAS